MNHDKPSKIILFSSIVLMIINLCLSYVFSGRSIVYVIGNVFGFTMIVIALSSFFSRYRNSRSRWIITLNTMIISFMIILGDGLVKATKEFNDANNTKMKGENIQTFGSNNTNCQVQSKNVPICITNMYHKATKKIAPLV